jgi:hypothetical protein
MKPATAQIPHYEAYATLHLSNGQYSVAGGTKKNPVKHCIAIVDTLEEAQAMLRELGEL